MDEEDYFIRGIYQIYKEEIKGMGITGLLIIHLPHYNKPS